jgi:hypothetical protein
MSRTSSWCELIVHSLFLSTAILSGVVSASAYNLPQQVPIIPPQVPLNGPEATLDTHEFVRCPNAECVTSKRLVNNRLLVLTSYLSPSYL